MFAFRNNEGTRNGLCDYSSSAEQSRAKTGKQTLWRKGLGALNVNTSELLTARSRSSSSEMLRTQSGPTVHTNKLIRRKQQKTPSELMKQFNMETTEERQELPLYFCNVRSVMYVPVLTVKGQFMATWEGCLWGHIPPFCRAAAARCCD